MPAERNPSTDCQKKLHIMLFVYRPKDMIRDLCTRLSEAGIALRDVRLNGSAASYVVYDHTVVELKVRYGLNYRTLILLTSFLRRVLHISAIVNVGILDDHYIVGQMAFIN